MDLHWTFDYTRFNGDTFQAELMAALDGAYADGVPSGSASEYTVFPNFWGGYRPRQTELSESTELAFGTVRFQRDVCGEWIDYQIATSHAASGESLLLRFQTDNSPLRRLQGEWRIGATNCADGAYREFHAAGRLTESRQIHLSVDGISFVAGEVRGEQPLLCNWTLYDVLPELAKMPEDAGFAVLDDLEKLRPACRVKPVGTCCLPLATGNLELRGFVVFGEGMVPCHYWLDASGNVAIATSTFQTAVLSRMGEEA